MWEGSSIRWGKEERGGDQPDTALVTARSNLPGTLAELLAIKARVGVELHANKWIRRAGCVENS